MNKIPFNRPYLTGKELIYIKEAVESGKISGNGLFTKKCQNFFETRYGFKKTLLTTSCTDALEMSAMLIKIEEGDEVIVPSYTFVSSALAFVRQGAKIIFADSSKETPNVDLEKIESLISKRTKAIVIVHYAGVAVDMDKVMELAAKHKIFVVEDAAQSIDSYYKGKPLGGIGHLGTFSFHETKNVISGEGGLLVINDEKLLKRAEIIWEKGTNRASFFRGEINKYGWIDVGSSFLPPEIVSGFLYAQLENLDKIQEKRIWIWNRYYDAFKSNNDKLGLPIIPRYATNNAHMFYVITGSLKERTDLIYFLKKRGIQSVFHYLSLHKSEYYKNKYNEKVELPLADFYMNRLLRLPLFYDLQKDEVDHIINSVLDFFDA